MLQIIALDLFEVLLPGIWSGGQMGNLVLNETPLTLEQFAQRESGALWEDFRQLNRGIGDERSHWQLVIDELGWPIDVDTIVNLTRKVSDNPIPGMREILESLKPNYRLILISDIWPECKEYVLKRHPWLFDNFARCYFSCDTGHLKCDEGYFDDIVTVEHVKPSEILFIDDYCVNTSNAAKSGLGTILYKNAEQLRAALYERKVI